MSAPRFSDHAIVRYAERVRPGLALGQIRQDLTTLVAQSGIAAEQRPAWVKEAGRSLDGCTWLLLGDDLAFPIREGLAVSCLARGRGPKDSPGPSVSFVGRDGRCCLCGLEVREREAA